MEFRVGLLDRLCRCWVVGCWFYCEIVLGCVCVWCVFKCVGFYFICFEFGLVRK